MPTPRESEIDLEAREIALWLAYNGVLGAPKAVWTRREPGEYSPERKLEARNKVARLKTLIDELNEVL